MIKILFTFFATALALTTNLFAQAAGTAPLTIKAFEECNGKTTLMLSNGMVWECKSTGLFKDPYETEASTPPAPPKRWDLQDRVQIVYKHKILSGKYYLQNVSYRGLISVKLINSNDPTILSNKIIAIDTWNNDPKSFLITLDDGSKWAVGSWSGSWMQNWQIGDRMVISATHPEFRRGQAEHIGINLDRKLEPHSRILSNVRMSQVSNKTAPSPFLDPKKRPAGICFLKVSRVITDGNQANIVFNNGAVWQGSAPTTKWKVNDSVSFTVPSAPIHRLVMCNLTSGEQVAGKFVSASAEHLDTLQISQMSPKKSYLILNDGSVWKVEKVNIPKIQTWKIKDRIAIALQEKDYECAYNLINLDKALQSQETPNYSIVEATIIR